MDTSDDTRPAEDLDSYFDSLNAEIDDDLEDDEDQELSEDPDTEDVEPESTEEPAPVDGPPADEQEPAEDDRSAEDPDDSPAAIADPEDQPEEEDEEPVAEGAETDPEAHSAPDDQQPTEPSPFQYRVDGQEYEVPGARLVKAEGEDFIVMPADSWNRAVQPRLADRDVWKRKERDYQRQIDERDPENNEDVIRARTILEALDPLMDAAEKGDSGPLYEWLEDVRQNASTLRAKAENEVLRRQLEARTSRDEAARTEEQTETLQRDLYGALGQAVGKILQREEFQGAGLTPDELVERYWQLANDGTRVFVQVTDENRDQFPGLEPGWYVNTELIDRDLRPWVEKVRSTRKTSTKAEEARERNRKRLEEKKPKATVTGGGGTTPSTETRKPQSREEWEAQIAKEMRSGV